MIPLLFEVLNRGWIHFTIGRWPHASNVEIGGGAALGAGQQSKTKPPPMYKVLLLNDDFTPMDFVVIVLEKFFGLIAGAVNAGDAQGAP
jgi:hypothetical protein